MSTLRSEIETGKSKHWRRNVFGIGRIAPFFFNNYLYLIIVQVLTDEFRWNYSHLWLALIQADLDNIKRYGMALGTGELYPLFACMVTARSWNSVSTGIDKVNPTKAEVGIVFQ